MDLTYGLLQLVPLHASQTHHRPSRLATLKESPVPLIILILYDALAKAFIRLGCIGPPRFPRLFTRENIRAYYKEVLLLFHFVGTVELLGIVLNEISYSVGRIHYNSRH